MTNDLISREALKEQFTEGAYTSKGVREIIDNAPTVEYTFEEAFQKTVCENKLYCPARPQGEWELHGMIYYCSECGHYCGEGGNNFCGNCGADMRGGAV